MAEASKDAGPSWDTKWGVGDLPVSSANMSASPVAVTERPTTGKQLVIDDIIVSVDTDMSITFTEETSGRVVHGPWYYSASSGPVPVSFRGKKKLHRPDLKLYAQTSVAGHVTIEVGYHSEG